MKKRTLKKKIKYAIALSLLKAYVAILGLTTKRTVIGQAFIDSFIAKKEVCIPCFWHQTIIPSGLYLLDWHLQGQKMGYLISPSGDGTLAARVFVKRGVKWIKGSAGQSGSQTMRTLYKAIKRDNISAGITPDGPRGPLFDFKPGALLLASMTGAPIVPIVPACSRYWQSTSWDKFIIPKWFGKMTMVVGEPIYIERDLPLKELRKKCDFVKEKMMDARRQAEKAVSEM